MKVLREVSKTRQVVMATHSPLVVNELQPEEVTLVTRTESEGTRFTPITETTNFAQRAKTYALGELWLSFADGRTEAALTKESAA
jgi:predicted ATPase